jgi:hypothetical protein
MNEPYESRHRPADWTRRQTLAWFTACTASTLVLGLLLNWTFARPDPPAPPPAPVIPPGANIYTTCKVPPEVLFGLKPEGGMPAPGTDTSPQPINGAIVE